MADPLIKLTTPLGDTLHFLSMEGTEELSRLFEYRLVALAKVGASVDFGALLGKPVHVTVTPPAGAVRNYHALVTAISQDGRPDFDTACTLTLRPWLWLLTRASDVRIFQKMTVAQILKKVFEPYGGSVDFQLQGTYRKREYCVQYRESDFDFASRLMEEEGIFYFFVHSPAKHALVVADAAGAHANLQGVDVLPFIDAADSKLAVRRWRFRQEMQTTQVTLRDHSFLAPKKNYEQTSTVATQRSHMDLKAYDYPAGFAPYPDDPGELGKLDDEAKAIVKRRQDEQQSGFELAEGDTNSTNLCTGARFTLSQHPVAAQNREYIVLATRTKMRMPGLQAGQMQDFLHECHFTAFDAKVPFRPARITPRPKVAGPQTATVVGTSGEEIYVDKHGRVKLQFHWDREGKKDADSSCFVRVAQPAAGKGWGMVFLPRVGQEVVVDFLEGNPDQPLVTGRVYNADNMPPYTLADNKTVSTMKSRSTKGGGATDFNELRFEDLKGSEYLLMQSQKDKLEFVKETAKTQIGIDEHRTVKKDRKEKVEGEYHLSVVKDTKQKFDAKFSLKAAADLMLATDAQYSLKAGKDVAIESGTTVSLKSGTDVHIKAGTGAGMEAGTNVHIKGGVNVVIEGGMQLTIKAGAGSVVLGPDGVSITGPMVKINSGGSPGSGAAISPVAPKAPEAPTAPEIPKDPLTHS